MEVNTSEEVLVINNNSDENINSDDILVHGVHESNNNESVTIVYSHDKVDDMQGFINEVSNATTGSGIVNAMEKLSTSTNQLSCSHTFNRCVSALQKLEKLPVDFPPRSKWKTKANAACKNMVISAMDSLISENKLSFLKNGILHRHIEFVTTANEARGHKGGEEGKLINKVAYMAHIMVSKLAHEKLSLYFGSPDAVDKAAFLEQTAGVKKSKYSILDDLLQIMENNRDTFDLSKFSKQNMNDEASDICLGLRPELGVIKDGEELAHMMTKYKNLVDIISVNNEAIIR
jgi:hypothetical protein